MTDSIIVTGASSGIGKAVTEKLIENDYHVYAVARRPMPWWEQHAHITPVQLDLRVLSSIPDGLNHAITNPNDLHGLISCAGTGYFASLEEFSYSQIQQAVEINLIQHMLMARWVLPHLKQHNRGDLVFIGSDAGEQGAKQGSLYCACKFALRGFAQSLRAECNTRDIRVAIVQPGMVQTPFYEALHFAPGGGAGQSLSAEDVAQAVLFLLRMPAGTVIDEINLSPMRKVIDFKKT